MGKFGYRITLTEKAYHNLRKAKELIGARTWEEFSEMVLKLIEEVKRGAKT